MKNKEIINEINRMRNIMGLQEKPLVLEATTPSRSKLGRLFNLVDDILFGTPPSTIRRTPRVGGSGAKITFPNGRFLEIDTPRLSKIRNAITNRIPFNQLDDVTKSDMINILDEGGFLDGKNMYDDVVDDYIANGGQEDLWLKDIQRRTNSVDPRTGKANTLDEILLDEFEDPFFVNKIKPTVQKRIADLDAGRLEVDSSGRLVNPDASDIRKFNEDIQPFTPDEVRLLSKPGFIQSLKNHFKKGEEIALEIKRLYKNLQETGLTLEQRKEITNLIVEKTRQLANWKVQSFSDLKKFIDELSQSTNPANQALGKKLKQIEETNGGWDVYRRTAEDVSAAAKEWAALKASFRSMLSAERTFLRLLNITQKFEDIIKWYRKQMNLPIDDVKPKIDDGKFINTMNTGSPRGFPSIKVKNELGDNVEETVDYWKKLRDLGGMPLVYRSYFYEYLMRLVKWKLYSAVVMTIFEKIIFQLGFTKEEKKCLAELSKTMIDNGIYNSDALINPYKNRASWIPECVYKLDKGKTAKLFATADYIASAGSTDGQYFWSEFAENIKEMTFLRGLTDLIPGFWDNFAYDGGKFVYNWIATTDMEGPGTAPEPDASQVEESKEIYYSGETGFEAFCHVSLRNKTGWDSSTGIGTTNDGKKWNWIKGDNVIDGRPVGRWVEADGSPTPDTTIDTVEELYTKYPFLRGNESTITLNSDKTFNEKNPDGVNLTISIIGGKGYYTHYNGVPIDHLELKAR